MATLTRLLTVPSSTRLTMRLPVRSFSSWSGRQSALFHSSVSVGEPVPTTSSSSSYSEHAVDYNDVLDAADRLQGLIHETPVLTSQSLSTAAGDNKSLFFKVEAMQKTGSFKFRGALNAMTCLLEEAEGGPVSVVTHSSGNHAQALTYAARLAGRTRGVPVQATTVTPHTTPAIKQAAIRGYGGDLVLVENSMEARKEGAAALVAAGATEIHSSNDPAVIAGQGTVCHEMIHQVAAQWGQTLDAVIVPVSGGGLASGSAIACRALLGNHVKIILAEPSSLDDAKRSFAAGEALPHHPENPLESVADGLKSTLGTLTWPILRDLADGVITVSEEEILRATKMVWERLKVFIEPSSGVPVAVAMSDEFKQKFPDVKNVGIVLSGGNTDVIKIAKAMNQYEL